MVVRWEEEEEKKILNKERMSEVMEFAVACHLECAYA